MDTTVTYSELPKEILVEIASQLSIFDLSSFESTSKYWFNYFKRSDAWKNHYEAITCGNDISKLPMNYWWQTEERCANRHSTLLDTHRGSRQLNERVLAYISPPYKYYIKAILNDKKFIRKELEWIHASSDLSLHEKNLAVKLYWLIHTKFPRLNFELDLNRCDTWVPDENKEYFPDGLKDLADSKPLFYWDDADGDNYLTYIWMFWMRSDYSITMYLAMRRSYQKDLQENQVINMSLEEFAQKNVMEFLFELPTGERKNELRRHRTVQNSVKIMQQREAIYSKMSAELNWKLDEAAKTVLDSVNMSPNIRQQCVKWLSEQVSRRSKNAKSDIIRCLRRVLWFLLKKEIVQNSLCAPAIYVKSRSDWKEKFHNNTSDHMAPKYWALYLIEKAYYCVDPLTELLIQLLINQDTSSIQKKLTTMNVDTWIVEKAIMLFHSKE